MERKISTVKLLGVKEMSEILGSRGMVYRLFNRADFPTVIIGGRKLVREDKFYTWLDAQENKPDTA